jgi:hypothetical protein
MWNESNLNMSNHRSFDEVKEFVDSLLEYAIKMVVNVKFRFNNQMKEKKRKQTLLETNRDALAKLLCSIFVSGRGTLPQVCRDVTVKFKAEIAKGQQNFLVCSENAKKFLSENPGTSQT